MTFAKKFPLIGLLLFATAIFLPQYTLLPSKFYLLCLSIIFSGWQIFRAACINLAKFRVDANVLITLAIIGLISLSLLLEAAIYICLIGTLNYLQSAGAQNILGNLRRKWQNLPATATKVVNGEQQSLNAEQLVKNDLLALAAGQILATDAVVEEGEGKIQPLLIGKNNAELVVGEGDFVAAGTELTQGKLLLRATANQADTLMSKTGRNIDATAQLKSSLETVNYNQTWAKRLLTLIFFMILPFFFFKASLMTWLNYSITILLIFAPYNAIIETAGLLAAIAVDKAAKLGIIVNQPLSLEEAAQVQAVAFEKDTTLVTGELILSNTYAPYPYTRKEILASAALLMCKAAHPLSGSVLKQAGELELPAETQVEILSNDGYNIRASVAGQEVILGNNAYLEQNGIKTFVLLRKYSEYLTQGSTVLFVAIDGQAAGLLSFIDDVHPQVYATVGNLRANAVPNVIMMTKEQERASSVKVKPYGFTEIMSDLSDAAKKAPSIQKLHFDYGSVLVVGDARKDLAIMKNADISVAVHAEKDLGAAEELADLMLLGNYFYALPKLFALGKNSLQTLSMYKRFAIISKLVLVALSFLSYLFLWQIILLDGILGILLIYYCARLAQKPAL